MPSRRLAIAACAILALMIVSVSGCSREPGPCAPGAMAQPQPVARIEPPFEDPWTACDLEKFARGRYTHHRNPPECVLEVLPRPEPAAAPADPRPERVDAR